MSTVAIKAKLPASAPAALTSREVYQLRLLAGGRTHQQIGREFGISETAARTAAVRIYQKLGADNAAHAVHLAHQRGLLGDQRTEVAA